MKRFLFNVLAATAFLLFLIFAFLWIRSELIGDSIVWENNFPGHCDRHDIASSRGEFLAQFQWTAFIGPEAKQNIFRPSAGNRWSIFPPQRMQPLLRTSVSSRLGLIARHSYSSTQLSSRPLIQTHRYLLIVFPYWFAALLTALLPTRWFIRWRRRLKYPPGTCQRCGYDLRASPHRCPECGIPAPDNAFMPPASAEAENVLNPIKSPATNPSGGPQ